MSSQQSMKTKTMRWNSGAALFVMASTVVHASAQTTTTTQPVIFASGGGTSAGGGYLLAHTLGEPIIGDSTRGGYTLAAGFWGQENINAPGADLQVTMAPLQSQINEGESLPVTMTVINAGPANATSAQLTFSIPSGSVLQSISSDRGGCTVQGSNVTCSVNTLSMQQNFSVQ